MITESPPMEQNASSSDLLATSRPPHMNSRKKLLVAFSVFAVLLLSGLGLALLALQSNQDNRQQASTMMPVLKFSSPTFDTTPNQEFEVQAVLDSADKQITATALKITFNPEFLEAKGVSNANGFPLELMPASIDNTNGVITYVLGVPATGYIFNGVKPIANLRFKALKAGQASIAYDQNFSAATELNNPSPNVLMGYIPSTVVIADGSPISPVPVSCHWCGATCVSTSVQECTTETPPAGATCGPVNNICQITLPTDSTKPTVSIVFKLQGLNKANVEVPMQVTARYTINGEEQSDVYETVGLSNNDNLVTVSNLNLSNHPADFEGEVELLVKPTVALRKNLGTIQVTPGSQQYELLASDTTVLVGDFVRGVDANGRDQTNVLGLPDLTRVLNVFREANSLIVPATGANAELDVDYNGSVNLRDFTYAKVNLDDLYLPGD